MTIFPWPGSCARQLAPPPWRVRMSGAPKAAFGSEVPGFDGSIPGAGTPIPRCLVSHSSGCLAWTNRLRAGNAVSPPIQQVRTLPPVSDTTRIIASAAAMLDAMAVGVCKTRSVSTSWAEIRIRKASA